MKISYFNTNIRKNKKLEEFASGLFTIALAGFLGMVFSACCDGQILVAGLKIRNFSKLPVHVGIDFRALDSLIMDYTELDANLIDPHQFMLPSGETRVVISRTISGCFPKMPPDLPYFFALTISTRDGRVIRYRNREGLMKQVENISVCPHSKISCGITEVTISVSIFK